MMLFTEAPAQKMTPDKGASQECHLVKKRPHLVGKDNSSDTSP